MPDSYEVTPQEMLTHQEIVDRFRKVFGRDMTPAERRSFFLDLPLSKGKDITNH
jgi:hypothetical protein